MTTGASLLAITGPIYLLIAAGWLASRMGLFARADMRVFGQYVVMLGLPALLFNALSQRRFAEVIHPGFLAAYALGSLLVIALAMLWARWAGHRLSMRATLAMGMVCSNSGFIGFPLVAQVFGASTAGLALALAMIVENLLLIPLLLAIADSDTGDAAEPGRRLARWSRAFGQSLKGLARNPMIHGIALGLVFSLLQWRLPTPVARAVDLLAASTAAVSLFVIGGSLAGVRMAGMLRDVSAVVVGKLLLHPLAVLMVVWLLPPMARELQVTVVLMAAVPMFGIYPILAQRHGHDAVAASAQLVTTVAGFATLTGLLVFVA